MKRLINYRENIICAFLLLSVAFIASLPAFRNGIYNGFDLWFHMGRIESIATELSNGQFPVRYETESWYGNGYISTTMYGNILLYIPAIMHLLGLATYRCYNLYVIMINILGVAICFYSFGRLFKDKVWALFASLSYMLAGYYIANIYVRAAAGEYTATIFIPLVVYGLYRILYEDSDKGIIARILPLVIGASGLIETHVLTTYMVAMMVMVYLLIFIKDTWAHIKELLISLLAILGVNAFFIFPFLDSYTSYTFRAGQTTVGVNIQKYGLYLDQIFGLFPEGSGGRAEWSSKGEESSRIGIVQVMLFLIMTAFIIMLISKRYMGDDRDKDNSKRITVVYIIGILAAWLSSAFFPWWIFSGDNAFSNIMRGVQYPSRYLVIQTMAWTLCGTYALKKLCEIKFDEHLKKLSWLATFLMFILAVLQTGIFMYTLSCRNLSVQTIEGHESIADDLYLISGVDMDKIESEARLIDGVDCQVTDLGYSGMTRQIAINNQSKEEATVLIPVFCYKYIEANSTSGQKYELAPTNSYQYCVIVEPGFSDIMLIRFKEPVSWRIAEIISVISIALIVLIFSANVRKSKSLLI